MRKVIMAALVALSLVACQSKHHASSPQVSANEAKAQAIVQKCAAHGNFLTHAGRMAFVSCISPPGKKAQTEQCVQRAAATDHLFTKSGRVKFESDVSRCILP